MGEVVVPAGAHPRFAYDHSVYLEGVATPTTGLGLSRFLTFCALSTGGIFSNLCSDNFFGGRATNFATSFNCRHTSSSSGVGAPGCDSAEPATSAGFDAALGLRTGANLEGVGPRNGRLGTESSIISRMPRASPRRLRSSASSSRGCMSFLCKVEKKWSDPRRVMKRRHW